MTDDYPLALEGCDSREELAMEILLGRKNAEITRLRAEVERLRGMLKARQSGAVWVCPECDIAGCRHERAALAELKGEDRG